MRFTTAWSEICSQNVTLRFALVALSICLVFMGAVTIKFAGREPLIIDRGCTSFVTKKGATERTEAETIAFLRDALSQRFDSSTVPKEGMLSRQELANRDQEQKEFTGKEIKQAIVMNGVEIHGKEISVDADRLLSVRDIRSAFSFPIKVVLASTGRCATNPYGLVLVTVTPMEKPNDKK